MENPPREHVEKLIRALAAHLGLDPAICIRQCEAESGFRQDAISPVGAVGLMQLMPKTAATLGVDPKKWTQNVAGGMKYLAVMMGEFGSDYAKALAAYNCGPTRLKRIIASHGEEWRDNLPVETRNYLAKILV